MGMTNRDWLFSLPLDDQVAWMNAEHQDGTLDGDTAALNAKIAELTAERDTLQGALDIAVQNESKLEAERDKLKELNEYHTLQYELASEDCDRLQAQVDKLTAEREHYREKFGKCIDYADAIHALMDDEGPA